MLNESLERYLKSYFPNLIIKTVHQDNGSLTLYCHLKDICVIVLIPFDIYQDKNNHLLIRDRIIDRFQYVIVEIITNNLQ